jgi:NADH-quinone oxidoreductase subunit C
MNNTELKEFILDKFPEAEVTEGKQFLTVILPKEKLHEAARVLKDSEETAFDYLFCLSGVDYPEYMELVYHMESSRYKHQVVLKTRTAGRENPELDSVTDLWNTAEFHEREVYDLLGVKFTNHPDLRRLFLEDHWGFPLRKDYEDETKIVER